jgi:hypothetical protein
MPFYFMIKFINPQEKDESLGVASGLCWNVNIRMLLGKNTHVYSKRNFVSFVHLSVQTNKHLQNISTVFPFQITHIL